jgi:hypothetical protein
LLLEPAYIITTNRTAKERPVRGLRSKWTCEEGGQAAEEFLNSSHSTSLLIGSTSQKVFPDCPFLFGCAWFD